MLVGGTARLLTRCSVIGQPAMIVLRFSYDQIEEFPECRSYANVGDKQLDGQGVGNRDCEDDSDHARELTLLLRDILQPPSGSVQKCSDEIARGLIVRGKMLTQGKV
jgi:hypothetical protein